MNIANFTEEKKQLLIKSGDVILCEQVFRLSQKECEKKNIVMTDVQQLSLISHLSAMVHRYLTADKLEPIDRSLFWEVSEESLNIAREVKGFLENLEEDEIYLLSTHFEVAKINS